MPRLRSTVRRLVLLVAVVALGLAALRWQVMRAIRRQQMAYHAASERDCQTHGRQLREALAALERSGADEASRRSAADRVFELLDLSAVAARSKEVAASRRAVHSDERTAVARKWGRTAVGEAEFHAALHRRWLEDYRTIGAPHHITDDEIPPFPMPDGWTEDDLRY